MATVDRMIMDGHGLPFDESDQRDNFVATIMAVMADSSVSYPELPSAVDLKANRPTEPATAGKD